MAKGKNVLISGYIGFGNFGDEAIFSCLVSYLKSKGINVSALTCNKLETKETYSVKTYYYKSILDIIRAIFSCDVLFSGGGSLLQNNTSNKSLYYYLGIINLAKLFGKRVVIFAQGMEGIKGDKQIKILQKTLKKCNLVTVRDEKSKEILNSLGLEAKLLCDPVYSLDIPPYNPQNILGIQLRKYSKMHPVFLENLSNFILNNFKDKEIKILPFEKNLDYEICDEFLEILKRKNKEIKAEVIKDNSINTIKNEFSKLDYLIAMRFHACILGSMFGIKTIPIIYDNKVLNLAKNYNLAYIDCKLEMDFEDKLKDLEKQNPIKKPIFEWETFDKIIQ